MDYRKQLLEAAEAYCKTTGLSRATVGNYVAKDNRFFDRIESGGGCTIDTFQKVMRWFSENTPAESKPEHTSPNGEEYAKV